MNVESDSFRAGCSREAAYQAGALSTLLRWRRHYVVSFPDIRGVIMWLNESLRLRSRRSRGRAYVLFGCHSANELLGGSGGETFTVADIRESFNFGVSQGSFDDAIFVWQRCRTGRLWNSFGSRFYSPVSDEVKQFCQSLRQNERRADWYGWLLQAMLRVHQEMGISFAQGSHLGSTTYHFEVASYGETTTRETRLDGSVDYQGLTLLYLLALMTRGFESGSISNLARFALQVVREREEGNRQTIVTYDAVL